MNGGDPGSRGLNTLTLKSDERTISLGGKNTIHVLPGDVLTILTPGGGGFGAALTGDAAKAVQADSKDKKQATIMSSGSLNQYTLDQESV